MGSFGLGGGAIGFASAGSAGAGSPSTLTSPVTTDPLTFSGACTFNKAVSVASANVTAQSGGPGSKVTIGDTGFSGDAAIQFYVDTPATGFHRLTTNRIGVSGTLELTNPIAGNKAMIVKGAASQSVNLFEVQSSGAGDLAHITQAGRFDSASLVVANWNGVNETILGYNGSAPAPAIAFVGGGGYDTNLYRSAADLLATDDGLVQVGAPVSITATGTLALTHAGRAIEVNAAGAVVLTVPPNSSVAYPIGTTIEVNRYGAGSVTFLAGAAVTIRSKSGLLAIGNQYGSAVLRKRGTDEWILVGDLA